MSSPSTAPALLSALRDVSADASIKACFGADFCRPMVAQEGQEFARSGRSRKGDRALMGWMPPPDGIEVCQAGDVA
jgi:hypothetical protein